MAARAESDPKRLEAIIFEKNKRLSQLQQLLQQQYKKNTEINARLVQENIVLKEQNSRGREECKSLIGTIERQKFEIEQLKARNDELFKVIVATFENHRDSKTSRSLVEAAISSSSSSSAPAVTAFTKLLPLTTAMMPDDSAPTTEETHLCDDSNSMPFAFSSPPRVALSDITNQHNVPSSESHNLSSRFVSSPRPARPRRTQHTVAKCYKEPSLNTKLRKGDPHTFGINYSQQ